MNIEFGIANPAGWWVVSLAVLSAVLIALRALDRRRQGRLERFVEAKLAGRLLPGFDASARRPLAWLTLLGFAALALAIAQPHWGETWREIRRHSRDIVVLLDTSESMRAANPLPDRMARAKQKVASLLDRARADRFAIIAFSGAAELQCPLTLDHGYVRTVLESIDTNTISREGTDIAAAFDKAIELFQAETGDGKAPAAGARAILLISDGEQVSGDAVDAAARSTKYARVFVIGIGDPRGAEVTLPDWMTRYVTALDGEATHFSKLDEDTLSQIALAGNGAYTRSRLDTWDIDEILERLNTLSTRDTGSDIRQRLVNRYQWPLALALLAFMGEGAWLALLPLLRRQRMRRATTQEAGDAEYA
ncbi:MAG: aerotolerance regulator BatB [Candidatus Hydrogenedentota bacterium]